MYTRKGLYFFYSVISLLTPVFFGINFRNALLNFRTFTDIYLVVY